MVNLAEVEFIASDIFEINYLSWVLDTKLHLITNGFRLTIVSSKVPQKKIPNH